MAVGPVSWTRTVKKQRAVKTKNMWPVCHHVQRPAITLMTTQAVTSITITAPVDVNVKEIRCFTMESAYPSVPVPATTVV